MLKFFRIGVLAAVSMSCVGCVSNGSGGAGGFFEQACTTAEGYTVCEPSAPLPPGATPPPVTTVTASRTELADVALGTPSGAARAALAARLGPPEVEEESCLRPERRDSLDVPLRGQRLVWPSLAAFMTPTQSGESVLSGWEARTPPSRLLARYDVRLPYGTRLDQPVEEVLRQVPSSRASVGRDGPEAGFLIIRTDQEAGLVWASTDQDREGVVYEAAYDPEGCR